jgi:hypothetical protein
MNNAKLWEKEFNREIYCKGEKCKWCKGLGTCGSGINPDNAKSFIRGLLKQARQEGINEVRNIVVKTAIEGRKDQDEFKGLYLYSRVLSRIDELKKKGKK